MSSIDALSSLACKAFDVITLVRIVRKRLILLDSLIKAWFRGMKVREGFEISSNVQKKIFNLFCNLFHQSQLEIDKCFFFSFS